MIGRTLSHYRIVERLGAGGMGEVYRSHDLKLDRDVALKVLPEGALADEAARSRFRKEAHALSRLSHPHIATLLDFDSEDGVDFLVLELVAGPSLSERLRDGPLPEKDILRLGAQLARGLQAAHDHGIVHRDLKPSNLHLTPDGLLKILDFGLARLLRPDTSGAAADTATETAAGAVLGSPPYMAPEQLLGKPPDARTDLYAAGAVLYEMATGRRPFGTRSGVALTDAVLHEPPPPPRSVSPAVSPALESVILKALDKDPELRYQTPRDLLVDLERLQVRRESLPAGGGRGRTAEVGGTELAAEDVSRPRRRRAGRRGPGLVAGAAALLAVGLAIAWWVRPTHVPRITGARALTTFTAPNPGFLSNPSCGCLSSVQYASTDGRQIYVVTVTDGRNVLREVPLDGGEASDTVLPFRGTAFLLCAIPGESAVIMTGSGDELAPVGSDEGWPLWRVPVGGGAPQRIGDLLARAADVSPDGRSLAFVRGNSLMLATIDGANSRELHSPGGSPWSVRWSPDGTRLRYAAAGPGGTRDPWIWEIPATGGEPRALWPGWLGEWTADGRSYVFNWGTGWDLYAATEAWWTRWRGAVAQPLLSGPVGYEFVGSTRDGHLVAILHPPDAASGGTLTRYDPKRKAFEPALGGESAIYAAPSSDGQWLAWVRNPEATLWRSRPDGSERLRLSSAPALAYLPRWSPDGRWIAYSHQPDPRRIRKGIRLVASDGTEAVTIAEPPDPEQGYWDPCWLPDGSILFSQVAMSRPGILRYDPATRSVGPWPGAEALLYPKCSPRGAVLATAFGQGESHWRVREWGTNEWRDLGRFTHAYPTWRRDGRSVCALSLAGYRIECMEIAEPRMKLLADTAGLHLAGIFVPWMGLDAEDRPLVTVTSTSQEPTIYALDWEAP